MLLEGREFGFVGMQDGVLVGDEVALGEAVEAQDLLGGGPAGGAFFGLERIIRQDQGKKAFSGLELVC